ncbi:fibronectin type III domain-containing protein [Ectothiorhodospira marina]|uniref:Fibronectin type-III domain-containing protein n=1 Tax=Ectothiorhodospira marina TaxID=1396821 RepID=A0A1H7K567_9GAMM|nr:fibronectin type III domain-containing protein [Ectothiorhodospira marina]SEK81035.1 hypothetical protein SAMN05444515_105113 [Ectothiorhodospira marina]
MEDAHPTLTGGILDLGRLLNEEPANLLPFQPTYLEVRRGNDGMKLSWLNNSASATGQTMERCDAHELSQDGCTEDDFLPLGALDPQTSEFTDADASALEGTLYTYRIRASSAQGNSPWSNTTQIVTPPLAPADPNATRFSDGIRLTWTNRSQTAERLRLERSRDGGAFEEIAELPPDNERYENTLTR